MPPHNVFSFTIAFKGREATSCRLAATGQIVAVVVDKTTETPIEIPEAFKTAVGTEQIP